MSRKFLDFGKFQVQLISIHLPIFRGYRRIEDVVIVELSPQILQNEHYLLLLLKLLFLKLCTLKLGLQKFILRGLFSII